MNLLLVSSRDRLKKRFGKEGFDAIRRSIDTFGRVSRKRGTELTTVFIDDPASTSPFGLKPVRAITPGTVKRAIDGVVAKLAPRSRKKISILILGGGEVIPYFELSNPACDSDKVVHSDNPYGCDPGATSAEKCLLPDRAVGRLPDGDGSDIEILLGRLREPAKGGAKWATHAGTKTGSDPGGITALGYTAAVWRKATRDVWTKLGWSGTVHTSPPLNYLNVKASWFSKKSFLYFNLHGSDTAPYWYGQQGSSFPTALSPANVSRFNRDRNVVLTEACYGAVEMGKRTQTSIALAFLSSRSLCVVGSTSIAYGALAPPGSEADLIALHFFENVIKGMTFGKSLVSARAQLAAHAISTQGYLDEDDRKTLLQFVLFGDPTATYGIDA